MVSSFNWFHASFNTPLRILYIHNAPFRTNKCLVSVSHHIFPHGATAPSGPGLPHYGSFRITLRHTTVGRTPLDEWSARITNFYLTTHNNQSRETSMPPAGFEPTIPASERPLGSLMTLLIPKMLINLNMDCRVHTRYLWVGDRGGQIPLLFFFLPKNSQLRRCAIGVRMGGKGVCLLRSGSNESSPNF